MRLTTIVFLLIAGLGCTTNKKVTTTVKFLNGTWAPIRQEIGGKELPAIVFEKQKLIINDSAYTVIAESVDKGIVYVSDNKMDIYGKEGANAGKHFTAIYKLENGLLTVCYNLAGDSYPETFDTKSQTKFFLSVYKKE